MSDALASTDRQTIPLFGMSIDVITMPETIDKILSWCDSPREAACRFVVTPNVDHAVMYQSNDKLRAAYDAASLVLADGAPVVVASRLLRRALPERVPGSDLAPAIFKRIAAAKSTDSNKPPLRVFLLGAGPGVAERAATNIAARWPGVEVVGTLSPPLGFEHNAEENERILDGHSGA